MRGFQNGVIGQVEETKDDYQHYWYDDQQALARALLVLILATPVDVVARRQLQLVRKFRLGLVNEAAYIATAYIEQYRSPQQPVLAGDHRWSFDGANLSELRQWNGRARW